FSSKRVAIFASDKIWRAILPVASVDPSLTTINWLSGALAARYSIVTRSVSLTRLSSLKQGMIIENGGSMESLNRRRIEPLNRKQLCHSDPAVAGEESIISSSGNEKVKV